MFLNLLHMVLKVPFMSAVRQKSAEVPVIGSTKQLLCYPLNTGYPGEVTAVMWYKDGEEIRENQKYQMANGYL